MIECSKNLIVTLADANFISQAKQLFSSVYFNSGWQGDYMLLTDDIPREDREWFEKKGIIVYSPPLISNVPLGSKKYIPLLLSKLYFFKEEFKKWQKIIFLDADIIVRASLDNLLLLPGFNAALASTFKFKNEFIDDRKKTKFLRQKYDFDSLAFNTGVFIFDTSLIEPETFDRMIKVYDEYGNICEYGEESILNIFFYKNWKRLAVSYNSDILYLQYKYGLERDKVLTVIAHFCCAQKPWNELSPYYKEWTNNLKKAENINLSHRPVAAKIITVQEISDYEKILNFRHYVYPIRYLFLKIWFAFKNIFLKLDNLIWRFGSFIKQKSPKLYDIIKLKRR